MNSRTKTARRGIQLDRFDPAALATVLSLVKAGFRVKSKHLDAMADPRIAQHVRGYVASLTAIKERAACYAIPPADFGLDTDVYYDDVQRTMEVLQREGYEPELASFLQTPDGKDATLGLVRNLESLASVIRKEAESAEEEWEKAWRSQLERRKIKAAQK